MQLTHSNLTDNGSKFKVYTGRFVDGLNYPTG